MELVIFFGGRLLFNYVSYFTMIYFLNIFLTSKDFSLKNHFIWISSYSIAVFLGTLHYYNVGFFFYPEIISLLFLIIYLFIFYKNRFIEKLFVFSSWMLFFYTLEIVLEYIILNLFGASPVDNTYRLILILTRLLIIGLYHFIFLKKGTPNMKIDGFEKKQVLAFTFMLFSCVAYAILFDRIILNNLTSVLFVQLFKIITILVLILFSFGSLITVNKYNNEKKLEYANTLSKEQLKLQLNHYQNLEVSLEETRRIKHDMKNHIICLKYLVSKGEYDKFESYIGDIETSIDTINTGIYTGNNVIDAIINQKSKLAHDNNISFKIHSSLPSESFIQSIDLCAIVSNSIDNAIEACLKLSSDIEKLIILESYIKKKHWIYKLKNSSDLVHISYESNLIKTSKEDTINHGLGLKNIYRSVNNYGGTSKLTYENNNFEIIITIPINWIFYTFNVVFMSFHTFFHFQLIQNANIWI